MNVRYYLQHFLFETQLEKRISSTKTLTAPLRSDLDEAIVAAVRALKDLKKHYRMVLAGPQVVLPGSYSRVFVAAWKNRAADSVKCIDRFLCGTTNAKERSILYAELTRRGFRIPAPQPLRPTRKNEESMTKPFLPVEFD